jgi:Rrf2 family protein
MAIIKRETDYALRVLSRLTVAPEDEFLSATTLAQEVDVPVLFLRKIAQALHKADLLESRQGPFGGYRLAVDPGGVAVLDVIEIVQGPLVMNSCFGDDRTCSRQDYCPVRDKLALVQSQLDDAFAGVTLEDVARAPAKNTTESEEETQ